jgi:hypothetical protein
MPNNRLLSRFLELSPWRLKLLAALIALGFAAAAAQAQTTLGTQTLSLNAQPDGLLYWFPSSLTFTKTGTVFDSYTSTITIQYRARTTTIVGTGSITVKASADFVCASGGPCIATPPSAGDALGYTCSGATLGSNCPGTQTISTGGATSVVNAIPAGSCTGGGNPCTTANPNTVTMNFTLTDDPKYRTGSYTATLILTISTT